ncbi:MAG: hypothetical protein J6Q61_06685 [Bacteroidales bacterium]|nr:hypothetical protein [Bacteroidales bacterium]
MSWSEQELRNDAKGQIICGFKTFKEPAIVEVMHKYNCSSAEAEKIIKEMAGETE